MGFFEGSATFRRFRAVSDRVAFADDDLTPLRERAIGTQKVARLDGGDAGWTASEHVLDKAFHVAKNRVLDDLLLFGHRVDGHKFPADLLKAYRMIALRELVRYGDRPTARQKREAKEQAVERMEHEAKDGRYLKRKATECLWDAKRRELLYGGASAADVGKMACLFRQTFAGVELQHLTAGSVALGIADVDVINGLKPTVFVPGRSTEDVAWVKDASSRDFLGNEFLLWLWFFTANVGDSVTLEKLFLPSGRKMEATVMFSRHLLLDCPRGQTGVDGFKHAGPTRLPEAFQALRLGKLPRRAGLTIEAGGDMYELTLDAEPWVVSGASLPKVDLSDPQARREVRARQLRDLIAIVDGLYGEFLKLRMAPAAWADEVAEIRRWLKVEEKVDG